jgi:hypothetical protein
MTLETLEDRARKDTLNEHSVQHGDLLVVWDFAYEYYRWPKGRGEPIGIDRDEAIDLLHDIEFRAHRIKK